MTTIAWDGNVLAADRRCTADGFLISDHVKKLFIKTEENWRIDDKIVVAFAYSGGAGAEYQIKKRLQENITLETVWTLKEYFVGVFIFHDGTAVELYKVNDSTTVDFLELNHEQTALGSGTNIALTAMHLGKGAIKAVQTAIELNVLTGGGVDSFDYYNSEWNTSRKVSDDDIPF